MNLLDAQKSLRTRNETLELHVAEQTQELIETNRGMKVAAEDLRLAAVAFESHDSMMITDHKGTILRVNGGFTTMTGYAAEDVIGHTPRILKSGRHSPHSMKICGPPSARTDSGEANCGTDAKTDVCIHNDSPLPA